YTDLGTLFVGKCHHRFPGIGLLVVPQTGTTGGDTAFRRHGSHFSHDQASTTHGAAAVMHLVRSTGHTVLGAVHQRGREHDTVLQLHIAQLEGREHGR